MSRLISNITLLLLLIFISAVSDAKVNADLFKKAQSRFNVPHEVLSSLCLTESGIATRGVWSHQPFALNIAGKGYYFNTAKEALNAIKRYQQDPNLSFKKKWLIDVGVCQINMYWHRDKISLSDEGIRALLTPSINIGYAASYLKELWIKNKSLKIAIGKYHSPSSRELAKRYRHRVSQSLSKQVVHL